MEDCENYRPKVVNICEVFEEFLYERGIYIPNKEREGDEDEACIYGSDWDDILERIDDLINHCED